MLCRRSFWGPYLHRFNDGGSTGLVRSVSCIAREPMRAYLLVKGLCKKGEKRCILFRFRPG